MIIVERRRRDIHVRSLTFYSCISEKELTLPFGLHCKLWNILYIQGACIIRRRKFQYWIFHHAERDEIP